MAKYSEVDISYWRGRIDGSSVSLATQSATRSSTVSTGKSSTDHGSRTVATRTIRAKRQEKDEGGLSLCDWNDEAETQYLKEGVDLPDDRSGIPVFEDGTVVTTRGPTPTMFKLNERDTELIEKWSQWYLGVVREVYDYSPGEKW